MTPPERSSQEIEELSYNKSLQPTRERPAVFLQALWARG
jgi:hypothetical protein